jgi:acyl-CoA reductase-like NAD-dependent aldehyde dehydrogenase
MSCSPLPHLPVLRWGAEYRSLTTLELRDHRTGEPVGALSQVNAGLLHRDLKRAPEGGRALRALPTREILERCRHAAALFLEAELPLSDGEPQSAERYRRQLSATSGLPLSLARANQEKIAGVLRELATVIAGLTRGLEPELLDELSGEQGGIPLWFAPQAQALGAVLPSNSPGVNALWIPALALKVPPVLKPGHGDPWTPLRLVRALTAAGLPGAAFGLYPTDHEGAAALLEGCQRALVFGDARTTRAWAGDPRIEIHGPGRSKVWIGADEIGRWEEHLDVLVASIAENGGRSCVNASCIVVSRRADEIAAALAERLAAIGPRPWDDPAAALAAFPDPTLAERIDGAIEAGLAQPGASDLCAGKRGPRRVTLDGASYLLPTLVRCTRLDHPLANTEYLFPFASVVELPDERALDWMGDTLVLTAITREPSLVQRLKRWPQVGRLNLGPLRTPAVRWDQPHEGNLFDFLYARRAWNRAPGW